MPGIEKSRKAAGKRPPQKKAARPAAQARSKPPSAAGEHPNGGGLRQQPDARGKYVYCIIQASDPLRFGPLGIGADPAEVHTVNYRNIAAVVSDTPIEVHDPTRENVLAHERVNETVMRKHTVIPMSFGTVFKTRDDIVELLRSAYNAGAWWTPRCRRTPRSTWPTSSWRSGTWRSRPAPTNPSATR